MLKKLNTLKTLAIAATVIGASVITTTLQAANTEVYLSVLGATSGGVTIGTTGAFNFGSFTVASSVVTTGKQFTGNDYFWVDDIKGSDSGYYTTISSTDLTGTNGTIPVANIAMKVDSVNTTLIAGTANANVVVANSLLTYSQLNIPVTFIKRDTAANAGKLGRYAAFPWLQVTIPAYQAVGSYHATLTYTIYEN